MSTLVKHQDNSITINKIGQGHAPDAEREPFCCDDPECPVSEDRNGFRFCWCVESRVRDLAH